MQGSFWKTVALVAVIGVGSLAVLEVQDKLKDSPSALESTTEADAALSADLEAVAENSVDAELSESDFDRMLKADFDSASPDSPASNETGIAADFDLGEPTESGSQTFAAIPEDATSQFAPGGPQSMSDAANADAELTEADMVSLSDSSPVNTRINAGSLSETPNPFAFADDSESNVETLSQNQNLEGEIQPAAFIANEQPPADSSSKSPFAAFNPEALAADQSTPPQTSELVMPEADANLTARQVGQMEFFGGTPDEAGDRASAKTVQATPMAFEQDLPADGSGSDPAAGGGFEQLPADDLNPQPTTDSASPFPGFEFGPGELEAPAQPDRLPNTESGLGEDSSPFFEPDPSTPSTENEDSVPLPRDGLGSREFGNDPGSSGTFDDSPSGTRSLPFAEDGEPDVPVLGPRPDPASNDGLEIPGSEFQRGFEPAGRQDDSLEFDQDRGFDDSPASDLRQEDPFDSRMPDRNLPGESPLQPDPFERELMDSDRSRDIEIDDRRRSFEEERMDRSEPAGVNPGFESAPGRVPTIGDREDDLRRPITNSPLSIDPGFGSKRLDPVRQDDFLNERGSDEFSNRVPGNRPVREFGGSDRSRDFQARPPMEVAPYEDELRPPGTGRDLSGSFSDRMRDEPRSNDDLSGSNIRQVASVMRPKLVLEKSAPENATVGTPLQYSITIRNDGDAPAYDVVVEDEVTEAGRIDAAKPQASRTNDGRRLIWKFDSIDAGTEQEILVQVTPTGEGVIDGVATVKFKSRVKATTMITAPRLQIQMEGPAKVRLGEKVQYRYVITNEGSGEARSVFVRTVLPQNGGLRHPQGQDLEYEIPVMEPGEQREILLSVVAGEPGNQQAKASVTSRNGNKDESSWSTDVIGAQLQMLRRGPKRRFVSRAARYENIVTNETEFDAVDARVVEQVPPGMEFIAAGQGGRYDSAERTVTWEIRRLAAKATTTLQLELEPKVAGQQDSRVTIFENIGAQSDDYVSTTVVEDLHNVSATISQLDGPVAMGEGFGFTVTVDNRGTADATDIQLTIQVPREITVEGAGTPDIEAGLVQESNTVIYQKVVRIKPNQQQNFELKLRGVQPARNRILKASVTYAQMAEPLEISESVTIYDDRN